MMKNNSENNSKVSYTIWINVWGADEKCWGAENKVFEKCYIFRKKSLYIYQHYITLTPLNLIHNSYKDWKPPPRKKNKTPTTPINTNILKVLQKNKIF